MSYIKEKNLINGRLLSILLLGFSAGLPLSLTSTTLQAWFTEANADLKAIGALSLIGLPYILKFLWAPLMDYFSLPGLGLRRGWIICMQACLVLSFLLLAQLHPETQGSQIYCLAILIAFWSASQDIAIDAYRTDILHPEERGLGASYYVFTYRVALLFSGGAALVFADYWGFKVTYEIMALVTALLMVITLKIPTPVVLKIKDKDVFQSIFAAIQDLLRRDRVIFILLFLIFYKVGDALASQLMTNFLLKGLGFSLTEVGSAYKIVSFMAAVLGGFAGGILLTRWNLYRALLIFGIMQAFSTLAFALLAMLAKQFTLMMVVIFVENFCSGLSTAALLAFMMSLCNHHYTASQFALLSAIASLGRVFLGPLAAFLVQNLGWVEFFVWSFMLSFPGILFLLFLKTEVSAYAPAAATDL